MSKMSTLNVRLGPSLQEHVAQAIGQQGDYDNASEYVRDLIRRDKDARQQAALEAKRMALQQAFHLPDEAYRSMSLDQVLERNRQKA